MLSPASEEGKPVRSTSLNELLLRQANGDGACELSLQNVLANLLEFAQDPHGSEYLRKLLEKLGGEEKALLVAALSRAAPTLADDECGYRVLEKCLDLGTSEQKKALVAELHAELLRHTNDQYGCRVVQKAIEYMPREAQQELIASLKDHVIACTESMHGNFVIQKCVEQMPQDSVKFIISAMEEHTEKMVTHRYGCRVIQRLLEHCAPSSLQGILLRVTQDATRFTQDPYGNYVVQHVLQHGRLEDKKRIIASVQGSIMALAQHKCASNVVDKCFEVASTGEHAQLLEEERASLVRAVLGEPGSPSPPIHQIMKDRFGQHIVTHMLNNCKGAESELLRQRIAEVEPQLKATNSGRRILAGFNRA